MVLDSADGTMQMLPYEPLAKSEKLTICNGQLTMLDALLAALFFSNKIL
jgi:hypothetical protein